MENLKRVLDIFREDDRIQQILEGLKSPEPVRFHLGGTIGAQDSFVLSATYLEYPQTHLLICNDKESAAYTQNNIDHLIQTKGVHFFPDSFKRPMVFE
ncbi:MAG: hypothetical protein AAGK97_05430, partial [Bacteroidota bacterium]